MATKKEKALIVEELREKFDKAQAIYLADFKGINVEQITELRKRFRQACDPAKGIHVEFKVVKNTLTERAAEAVGVAELKKYLRGTTALAFSMNDVGSAAKVLLDFGNEYKTAAGDPIIKIKVGLVEKKLIPQNRVKDMANLPPKEILIAMVLGGFQAPLSSFVGVLNGTITKFANVIDAIKKQKEEQGN